MYTKSLPEDILTTELVIPNRYIVTVTVNDDLKNIKCIAFIPIRK